MILVMMVLYHFSLLCYRAFFIDINLLKACLPWQVYDLMLLVYYQA
jgi:hypothetical protein